MVNKSHVAVYKGNCFVYPPKEKCFLPGRVYPEYPFKCTETISNQVYESVRENLHLLELDNEHYNTKEWNPLGEIIYPGQTVLIKPNLVMDRNLSGESVQCMYTQPSVVAPIIDYVYIALKGKGKIIIGDAPMQECDFDHLRKESGYNNLISYYQSNGLSIQMVDFRELTSVNKKGVHIVDINENSKGKVIDLAKESEFHGLDSEKIQKMRITNYDPNILKIHHTDKINEYYISDYILEADVIINMPKPKSHRKAGVTISLKNFVGANVRKEYLPHHTLGAISEGGDEYERKSIIHKLRSHLIDKKNILSAQGKYRNAKMYRIFIKGCSFIMRFNNNSYSEGSWYGNNTISKTVADINKVIYYADKNGVMCNIPQREIFIVADMIISGEKEGPVCPSPKNVGIIASGFNPVIFDEAIATLMGFDVKNIPTIVTTRSIQGKYKITESEEFNRFLSNDKKIHNKSYRDISKIDGLNFIPPKGWKGHIELSEEE